MARANPAISLAVSPFARKSTKNAEICAGSASRSASIAENASSSDKSFPAHKSSITRRKSTAVAGTADAKTTPPAEIFGDAITRASRAVPIATVVVVVVIERRTAGAFIFIIILSHLFPRVATEPLVTDARVVAFANITPILILSFVRSFARESSFAGVEVAS
jgi:hypothetical protein